MGEVDVSPLDEKSVAHPLHGLVNECIRADSFQDFAVDGKRQPRRGVVRRRAKLHRTKSS